MPTTNPASGPDATSGYVPVNGLDMYYEVHGEGSPLALFHGAMGTIDSCFANLLPALAATRQVVAIELQGHGHTADIDRPLSYRQMAADAAALLEALGIEMADLVGYSLGGAVALELAMQYPGRVRRLVFAGGISYRRDGLYPEMLTEPESAADDLTGSVWHQAYLRVAPDPSAWPVLVAKNNQLDRTFRLAGGGHPGGDHAGAADHRGFQHRPARAHDEDVPPARRWRRRRPRGAPRLTARRIARHLPRRAAGPRGLASIDDPRVPGHTCASIPVNHAALPHAGPLTAGPALIRHGPYFRESWQPPSTGRSPSMWNLDRQVCPVRLEAPSRAGCPGLRLRTTMRDACWYGSQGWLLRCRD